MSGRFSPIPELRRPDGDLLIAFLSGNGVYFSQPLDDDWYRATQPGPAIEWTELTGSHDSYIPTEPASPMGCVQQWQWCKSGNTPQCGPLASHFDALYGAAPLFNLTTEDLDPERPSVPQELGTRLIWPALVTFEYPTFLGPLLEHFGSEALASRSRFLTGVQWGLPVNQWQLDVIQWWNTMQAAVQASW